ncbi:hexose transporter [Theileria orientalis]|uniref:Hexose transporter 1 n=1 Tax=Theileria orientalis TaxID=68886 RepID=A0A976M7P1_THEOR|nr:hexose transporter [Theileria orientalis]
MAVKSNKSLVFGAGIGALGALAFGLTVANINTSKEFVIVNMEWCKGESNIFDCEKSQLLAGLCNGSTFIGAALGSLLIGVSGKAPRRVMLMVVNWLFIIGSILSASSINFGMLFIGRLLSGVGVGLDAIVPLFLVEICHPNARRYFSVIYQLFITFGLVLSAGWQLIHGRVVTNTGFELTLKDKVIWRGSQLLPALTSLVALLLIHFVFKFKTPYELIEKGQTAEARDVIEKLHGAEAVDEVYDEFDRDSEKTKSTPNVSLFKAFKNPLYRKIILHTFVLAAIQQLVGISVLTSNITKMFMQMMGRSMKSTLASSGMFLVNFVATVILTFVIGKYGRKTFLVWGIGFSTVFMALASFSKPIGKDAKWVPIVSIIGSFGFIIGFAVGLGGITWVYLSEVYPPEVKNGAMSVAVFINWACAAATVFGSEYLISYSEVLVNIILFAFSLLGFIYIIVFIKETKGVPLGRAYDPLVEEEVANEE